MFSKTDKVYASAKHSMIRDMCVDPDELVFTLVQSLFLFLKKDFLNSPTKIFFKMAAKLSKTTAIRREKTPNPELRPLFRGNDWTRCGNHIEYQVLVYLPTMAVFTKVTETIQDIWSDRV